jgi:hypothetical protein
VGVSRRSKPDIIPPGVFEKKIDMEKVIKK